MVGLVELIYQIVKAKDLGISVKQNENGSISGGVVIGKAGVLIGCEDAMVSHRGTSLFQLCKYGGAQTIKRRELARERISESAIFCLDKRWRGGIPELNHFERGNHLAIQLVSARCRWLQAESVRAIGNESRINERRRRLALDPRESSSELTNETISGMEYWCLSKGASDPAAGAPSRYSL